MSNIMFNIPDFEEDVPKDKFNFVKTKKKKRNAKSTTKGNKETYSVTQLKIIPSTPAVKVKKNKNKRKVLKYSHEKGYKNKSEKALSETTDKDGNYVPNALFIKNKERIQIDNSLDMLRNVETLTTTYNKLEQSPSLKRKKSKSVKSKITKVEHTNNDRYTDNLDSDKPDGILINAKKKKLDHAFKEDDEGKSLFADHNMKQSLTNGSIKVHVNRKKERIKKILEISNIRNPVKVSGNILRQRMMEKLKAAQFRYLNEKLYTSTGCEAQKLFQSDLTAFHTYHEGYQQQLKKWPINPLDVIAKKILKMPKSHVVADMGCGEAALSRRVPHTVHSFDLVATSPGVTACDMARTPLLTASVDVAVYCLALMGTELTRYLVEANRILKTGGQLLIAEVESRFDDPSSFARDVERLGFKLTSLDNTHKIFYFFEFKKMRDPPAKKSKLPALTLKPCLYKKR